MILNGLSKMKKYLLGSAVIYLDSVVNAGADYAVRRVVEGDSSHLIFAFQVIDWAPFFKSDIQLFFETLIFDTLLYRIYFITSITFDNKPSIELNFWSGYLDISRYFGKSGLLFDKKYDQTFSFFYYPIS